jgi:hypothetical protein
MIRKFFSYEETIDDIGSLLCVAIWSLGAWGLSFVTGLPWVNCFALGIAYSLFKGRKS